MRNAGVVLALLVTVLLAGCSRSVVQPPSQAPTSTAARSSATITVPPATEAPRAAAPLPAPSATVTRVPLAPTTTPQPSASPKPTATAIATRASVTLAAVGDMMLARSIGATLQRNPQTSPFTDVASALGADVTVGNLECAVGSGGTPARKSYTFLAPPAAAASVANAGFDVVTLANNHSLDYGPEALAEGLHLLDAAGVRAVGAGLTEAEAHRPAVISANGLRLAFLGYVDVPVEGGGFNTATWEARGDHPGLAWARAERIAADVAAAKQQADIVVVMLHSGYEGQSAPTDTQRRAAHAAIDAGAALVLGAHPHVLQGAERYENGFIAYSLGNFVFDGFDGAANETAILRLTLDRDGVRDVQWTPTVIVAGRPRLAQGQQAAAILARIERLSQPLSK